MLDKTKVATKSSGEAAVQSGFDSHPPTKTTSSIFRIGEFKIYGWRATATLCGILLFQALIFLLIGFAVGKGWL